MNSHISDLQAASYGDVLLNLVSALTLANRILIEMVSLMVCVFYYNRKVKTENKEEIKRFLGTKRLKLTGSNNEG